MMLVAVGLRGREEGASERRAVVGIKGKRGVTQGTRRSKTSFLKSFAWRGKKV